jgi:hypothetical protein
LKHMTQNMRFTDTESETGYGGARGLISGGSDSVTVA